MQIIEAAELIKILSEAYPRDEWSTERIKLWTLMLADLDRGPARESVLQWIRTEKWPPTIAEIRERTAGTAPSEATALQLCPPWESGPEPTKEQRAEGVRRVQALVKECEARIGQGEATKARVDRWSPEQMENFEREKARQLESIRKSLEADTA